MKGRQTTVLILLLAILVLVIAFFVLDFKAARSNTTANSQVSTIRSGESYDERPHLVIYVQASANLAGPLREALFNRIGTVAPFATVALTETPASEPGSAALVVSADRRTYIWTPVYATADIGVKMAFASDGQVDWNEIGEVDPVMQTSPEVRQSGELGIQDTSFGLISHLAYRNHIAMQISEKVVETVKTAFTPATP